MPGITIQLDVPIGNIKEVTITVPLRVRHIRSALARDLEGDEFLIRLVAGAIGWLCRDVESLCIADFGKITRELQPILLALGKDARSDE